MQIHKVNGKPCVDISTITNGTKEAYEHYKDEPVLILENNQPIFYIVAVDAFNSMMDKLDDCELNKYLSNR